MEFSETARILCFTIRLWGKQKNFVGGGGQKINSYTITLMTIFYLQQRDTLPPLSQLKRSDSELTSAFSYDNNMNALQYIAPLIHIWSLPTILLSVTILLKM